MSKRVIPITLVTLCLMLVPGVVAAYEEPGPNEDAMRGGEGMSSSQSATVYAGLAAPGWIQPYEVECSKGGRLRVEIMDCCMPGDHWMARAKIFDSRPTPFEAVSSGSTSSWVRVDVRPYDGGSTKSPTRTIIGVEYCHGVNVFPAGFSLKLTCLRAGSELTYEVLDQMPNLG